MPQYIDIVYKCITLSDVSGYVVKSKYFQRLKNLRQLGCCEFVFPHTGYKRFQHCLGVGALARYTAKHLQECHPEHKITDEHVRIVELAGLCHDLGHGPFSHVFDQYLEESKIDSCHEDRSIMLTDCVLKEIDFDPTALEIVKYCISPLSYAIDPSLLEGFPKALTEIVNNTIHRVDVDKMDYLVRDSYYWEAPQYPCDFLEYFDIFGILKRSRIVEEHWCFDVADRDKIQQLIATRYKLHRQFYEHPLVKSADCMMCDLFGMINDWSAQFGYNVLDMARLQDSEAIDLFCQFDDQILESMLNHKKASPAIVALIHRLLNRDRSEWYTHIGDFPYNRDQPDNEIELVWKIQMDNHTVANVMPRVLWHQDGFLLAFDHSYHSGEPQVPLEPLKKHIIYRYFRRS